jgi:outer membrane protein
MTRLALMLVFFFLSGWGSGYSAGFAQEASGEREWTLDECIRTALKNRPELEISNLEIIQAEYLVKEAASYYYPHLSLTGGYTRFNKPSTFEVEVDVSEIARKVNIPLSVYGLEIPYFLQQEFAVGNRNWYAATVDLTQTIYTFGRIEEGVKQARIGHSIALNQKEKKRGEVIHEVKRSFYQYLFAREMHELIKEGEARAGVITRIVKIAYETFIPEKEEKGTTRLDYLKARNFHSEVKARLGEARKNLHLTELALKMAIGVNTTRSLKVAEVALDSIPLDPMDWEELKRGTLERNPDLKNLHLGIQFYDSKRKAARREYFPTVGLQAQYVGPEDRFGMKNFWYAGIGIHLPIFDGFLTKARVGQAEAAFQKIKTQKMVVESAMSVQIDHLQATLTELKERVRILREGVDEAVERMQLAADGYAAGITEYHDLLLSQMGELPIKSTLLQSLFLSRIVKSEIEFISGMP